VIQDMDFDETQEEIADHPIASRYRIAIL